jgi:hypothetical protein
VRGVTLVEGGFSLVRSDIGVRRLLGCARLERGVSGRRPLIGGGIAHGMTLLGWLRDPDTGFVSA